MKSATSISRLPHLARLSHLPGLPCLLLGLLLACTACAQEMIQPEAVTYEVLEKRERAADHFTQGLFFDGERWLESSGLYGRSWLAEYTDPGRNPLRRKWLAPNRFAEGLAVLNDKIYLLTYRAGELQVYDRNTFNREQGFTYRGEGWGLTTDGQQLIMSDGSDRLSFRDPEDFSITRTIRVHGGGEQWSRLNELEFVHGLVWANIWQDPRIIAIDPASGLVKGVLNLDQLRRESLGPQADVDAVANGIAWDRARNGLWVTGKYWPALYLIRPRGMGF
ncbi:glutaminyl-peptide cyclotransferase [uncultured Microbulbifer sp.]|uniref:glutaminyl-peptide cyclotransferase n=1 Tax=uncultured Microbulbifer sp. TaxID=348147 RepID=UPI0025F1EB9D|nr:glutaminyl-peptide cyclotransferase [uncultured Microbulbifer sp.]